MDSSTGAEVWRAVPSQGGLYTRASRSGARRRQRRSLRRGFVERSSRCIRRPLRAARFTGDDPSFQFSDFVMNGPLLIYADGRSVVARDLTDGTERWRHGFEGSSGLPGVTGVAVRYTSGKQRVLVQLDDAVVALDARSGAQRWVAKDALVMTSDARTTVLRIADRQHLRGVRTDNGERRWQRRTPNGVLSAFDTASASVAGARPRSQPSAIPAEAGAGRIAVGSSPSRSGHALGVGRGGRARGKLNYRRCHCDQGVSGGRPRPGDPGRHRRRRDGRAGSRGRRRDRRRSASPRVGEVRRTRARGDRRRRPARHAGLGRRAHALRRPGHLGPAAHAVVVAGRHHRGDGQLRRRLRARCAPTGTTG